MKHSLSDYQHWVKNPSDLASTLHAFQEQLNALSAKTFTHAQAKDLADGVVTVVHEQQQATEQKFEARLAGLSGADLYRSVQVALFDAKAAKLREVIVAQKFEKALPK